MMAGWRAGTTVTLPLSQMPVESQPVQSADRHRPEAHCRRVSANPGRERVTSCARRANHVGRAEDSRWSGLWLRLHRGSFGHLADRAARRLGETGQATANGRGVGRASRIGTPRPAPLGAMGEDRRRRSGLEIDSMLAPLAGRRDCRRNGRPEPEHANRLPSRIIPEQGPQASHGVSPTLSWALVLKFVRLE